MCILSLTAGGDELLHVLLDVRDVDLLVAGVDDLNRMGSTRVKEEEEEVRGKQRRCEGRSVDHHVEVVTRVGDDAVVDHAALPPEFDRTEVVSERERGRSAEKQRRRTGGEEAAWQVAVPLRW